MIPWHTILTGVRKHPAAARRLDASSIYDRWRPWL